LFVFSCDKRGETGSSLAPQGAIGVKIKENRGKLQSFFFCKYSGSNRWRKAVCKCGGKPKPAPPVFKHHKTGENPVRRAGDFHRRPGRMEQIVLVQGVRK
jgi:hypothetical protein